MSARINQAALGLIGGRWRPSGLVQVWVTEPRTSAPGDPVACHCGATIYQTCKTKTGGRTKDHLGRRPRVCLCGGPLTGSKRRRCDHCTTTKRGAA